eukprot:Platyproteum_vivax@DN7292_c1_g1_i10.p1
MIKTLYEALFRHQDTKAIFFSDYQTLSQKLWEDGLMSEADYESVKAIKPTDIRKDHWPAPSFVPAKMAMRNEWFTMKIAPAAPFHKQFNAYPHSPDHYYHIKFIFKITDFENPNDGHNNLIEKKRTFYSAGLFPSLQCFQASRIILRLYEFNKQDKREEGIAPQDYPQKLDVSSDPVKVKEFYSVGDPKILSGSVTEMFFNAWADMFWHRQKIKVPQSSGTILVDGTRPVPVYLLVAAHHKTKATQFYISSERRMSYYRFEKYQRTITGLLYKVKKNIDDFGFNEATRWMLGLLLEETKDVLVSYTSDHKLRFKLEDANRVFQDKLSWLSLTSVVLQKHIESLFLEKVDRILVAPKESLTKPSQKQSLGPYVFTDKQDRDLSFTANLNFQGSIEGILKEFDNAKSKLPTMFEGVPKDVLQALFKATWDAELYDGDAKLETVTSQTELVYKLLRATVAFRYADFSETYWDVAKVWERVDTDVFQWDDSEKEQFFNH